ncbi:MAG: hypothetical protein ACFB12_12120 [Leptolyngbyaceae cyanobacterium]
MAEPNCGVRWQQSVNQLSGELVEPLIGRILNELVTALTAKIALFTQMDDRL